MLKGLKRVILWHVEREHFKKKPMIRTQFAFLKGRSTETALSRVVDKIESALLHKREALGVFLDIKGAFDNLDYEATIAAMRKRNMPEQIIFWYENYLKCRMASITLNGVTLIRLLTRGTPQGGVLSPMIWNVAFESLLARMSKHAFAISAGANIEIMQRHIQSALRVAEQWATENGLTFAPEKTVVIHFHRKHKPTPPPRTTLYGIEIDQSDSTKYLGMLLTRNLSWNAHIEQKIEICKSLLFAAR